MSTPEAPAEYIFSEDLYRIGGKFMVLIPVPWEALTKAEKNLLTKVLESIRKSLSAVYILTANHADLSLIRNFNPAFVLSFGVPINEVDRHYQLIRLNNTEVISADRLHEIDQARKEKLWPLLKGRFLAS